MDTTTRAPGALDGLAARHENRNFWLGVSNGGLFTLAETLLDPSLVLAIFISQLTSSSLLIGLLYPLRDGAWFLPQFWTSIYMQARAKQLPIYTRVAVFRAVVWGLLALAPFVITDRAWLLVAVFTLYAIGRLAAGLSGLAFMTVVAKTVPPVRRGPYFSWRNVSGGILAVAGGLMVNEILTHRSGLAFPHDFGLLFAASWVIGVTALFLFSFVVEPADESPKPLMRVHSQWLRARHILASNANYRKLIALRSLLLYAQAATPFFAIYAIRNLAAGPEWIGIYLTVRTVSGLVSTAIWGEVSARRGNRLVMAFGAILGLATVGLILGTVQLASSGLIANSGALLLVAVVFGLVGIHTAALEVAGSPLLLDMAPANDRSLYTGFAHTVLGLVLLSSAVSGAIADAVGLAALFAISFVLYSIACWFSLRLVEPRQIETALESA